MYLVITSYIHDGNGCWVLNHYFCFIYHFHVPKMNAAVALILSRQSLLSCFIRMWSRLDYHFIFLLYSWIQGNAFLNSVKWQWQKEFQLSTTFATLWPITLMRYITYLHSKLSTGLINKLMSVIMLDNWHSIINDVMVILFNVIRLLNENSPSREPSAGWSFVARLKVSWKYP